MVADVGELYHFGISIFDAEIKVGKVDRGRFGDEIGGDRDLAGYRRFDLFVFDKQKFVVFTKTRGRNRPLAMHATSAGLMYYTSNYFKGLKLVL